MVCTYKFFMVDRVWSTHTSERSQFLCTSLIFTHTDGQCFATPMVVQHITHYNQYLHYNIPSDWVVHNSPSGCIYCDGCHKLMAHFASICFSCPLNLQVIFYDINDSHFDDSSLNILNRHHIQYFILKVGDSVHYQTNGNGPNMNLNILYVNSILNCMRHHVTFNFTPPHLNYVLV